MNNLVYSIHFTITYTSPHHRSFSPQSTRPITPISLRLRSTHWPLRTTRKHTVGPTRSIRPRRARRITRILRAIRAPRFLPRFCTAFRWRIIAARAYAFFVGVGIGSGRDVTAGFSEFVAAPDPETVRRFDVDPGFLAHAHAVVFRLWNGLWNVRNRGI